MIAFFYPFGYFLFVVAAHLLVPFHRKIRLGILGRYKALNNLKSLTIPSSQRVVWFHVASSGEFEQLLPILDLLKEKDPNAFLFVTYYSPSGERSVGLEKNRRQKANKKIPWDYADYSPFDFRFIVKKVLKKIHPNVFVTIHREIWPSILMECSLKKIPCYLFSAYFPLNQTKAFWKYAPFMKYFTLVGTVDDQSVHFLTKKKTTTQVKRLGDPRIERVIARKSFQSSSPPYASFFEHQKVIILGSIWPKDFESIIEAIPLHKDKRFIFVPHEPKDSFSHLMMDALKAKGLKTRLWSRWLLDPDTTSLLIYDRVGGLFELYSIAYAAFVGGSFVKKVHNVLEPAAFSLPILTGPFIDNSREAKDLMKLEGLFKCENSKDISDSLNRLDEKEKYAFTRDKVGKFIQEGLGASKKYVELIV